MRVGRDGGGHPVHETSRRDAGDGKARAWLREGSLCGGRNRVGGWGEQVAAQILKQPGLGGRVGQSAARGRPAVPRAWPCHSAPGAAGQAAPLMAQPVGGRLAGHPVRPDADDRGQPRRGAGVQLPARGRRVQGELLELLEQGLLELPEGPLEFALASGVPRPTHCRSARRFPHGSWVTARGITPARPAATPRPLHRPECPQPSSVASTGSTRRPERRPRRLATTPSWRI